MRPAHSLLSRAHNLIASAFGSVSFTIEHVPGEFSGDLDQFQASRQLRGEGPGFEGDYQSQIVATTAQFAGVATPLERTLTNKRLTTGNRVFRIMRVMADEVSVTLLLNDWRTDRQ